MKSVTSNDIARIAGVSRSTVSRVVNGYPNVPEKTRRKVMEVIEQYHYYPQLSGQLLNGTPSRTIGMFWMARNHFAVDPLISSFVMNVIDACAERNYLLLTCTLDDINRDGSRNFIRKTFMERRIDAGIFIGATNDERVIDQLIEMDQIVGLFDYYHENENVPRRLTANFDGSTAEQSIDYLYSLGHRKIAVIDGDLSHISCVNRHEGYLRGFRKNNLTIRNKWFSFGGFHYQSGKDAALEMLKACGSDLPTAICANNDSTAFGVYTACRELGLRIPEDISVIGADGHPYGLTCSPPLTTFTFDFRQMFVSLTNRVIDTVEGKTGVLQDEFFPGTFVERGSCRNLLDC